MSNFNNLDFKGGSSRNFLKFLGLGQNGFVASFSKRLCHTMSNFLFTRAVADHF